MMRVDFSGHKTQTMRGQTKPKQEAKKLCKAEENYRFHCNLGFNKTLFLQKYFLLIFTYIVKTYIVLGVP